MVSKSSSNKSKNYDALVRETRLFKLYFVILSVLLVFAIGLSYVSVYELKSKSYDSTASYFYAPLCTSDNNEPTPNAELPSSPKVVYLKLPAVMDNNTGVYAVAKMLAVPGNGHIFIDVSGVILGDDTQQSIRKAIHYAAEHEGVKFEDYDFYVSIDSSAALLIGPSAGASFGVLAIGAIRGVQPNESVMMTGALASDGSIAMSGKILEKAKAAKASGAELFLVPVGLSKDYVIEPREDCTYYAGKEYCEVLEYANIIDISQEVGIPVIEVSTLDEALPYFGL